VRSVLLVALQRRLMGELNVVLCAQEEDIKRSQARLSAKRVQGVRIV